MALTAKQLLVGEHDGVAIVLLVGGAQLASSFASASRWLLQSMTSTSACFEDATRVETKIVKSFSNRSRRFRSRQTFESTKVEGNQSPLLVTGTVQSIGLQSKAVQNVLCGTVARTVATTICFPLDTIKTRLQVCTSNAQLQQWRRLATRGALSFRLASVAHGPRLVVPNWAVGGLSDLFRGVLGSAAGMLPAACVYFSVDEACRGMMEKKWGRSRTDMLTHGVASTAAALCSAFIRVPVDGLKHRVQAYTHRTMADAARCLMGRGGLPSLYSGFRATLMRDVPEAALQFMLFGQLKALFTPQEQQQGQGQGQQQAPGWRHLALGGAAGAIASLSTTPLDVIKTKMQCDGCASVSAAFQQVVSERGAAGLLAGAGPRVLQTSISCAIFFTILETVQGEIRRQQQQGQQGQRQGQAQAVAIGKAGGRGVPPDIQLACTELSV